MFVLTFGLLAGVALGRSDRESSPQVISATVHVRDVAVMRPGPSISPHHGLSHWDRPMEGAIEEHWRCAIFRVAFDQPLFATVIGPDTGDARHSFNIAGQEMKARTRFTELASQHKQMPLLFGSVRLICGQHIIESHPASTATNSNKLPISKYQATGVDETLQQRAYSHYRGGLDFLLPLHEPYGKKVFGLLLAAESQSVETGNTFVAALLLSGGTSLQISGQGPTRVLIREDALSSCEMRFLQPPERSWPLHNHAQRAGVRDSFSQTASALITNFVGDPVDAHISSFKPIPPPLAPPEYLARFFAASALMDGREKQIRRDGIGSRGGFDRAALLELAGTMHKEQRGGVHGIDVVSMYSMVEVVASVQDREVLEADQFFEAIEDPLLNMLVPAIIKVVIKMSKPTILGALCTALPPVLVQLLSIPTTLGMGGLPSFLEESEEIALPNFLEKSEHLISSKRESPTLLEFSEHAKEPMESGAAHERTWRRVDEISKLPEVKKDSRGQPMRIPQPPPDVTKLHTRTQTHRLSVEVAMAAARATKDFKNMRFERAGTNSKIQDAGDCAGMASMQTCLDVSPYVDDAAVSVGKTRSQKCAWCHQLVPNAFGVSARCVACPQVKDMESQGFKCLPDVEGCKAKKADPGKAEDEKKKKVEKDEPERLTAPLEKVIERVAGQAISQIGPPLHLALSTNLARDANSTVTRGAGRMLTHSITAALTQTLTAGLAQMLLRTLTAISTKEIAAFLTPSLTHAITPAVAQALQHSPQSDYYCQYCQKHMIYCAECRKSKAKALAGDYYAHYYAKYYSRYYAQFYSGIFADHFSRDIIAKKAITDMTIEDKKEPRSLVGQT